VDDRPPSSDTDLFRRTVGKVKRLRHDTVTHAGPRPAPIPRQRLNDERAVIAEMAAGLYDHAEIETGDELHFRRPGLQHGVYRNLRRGQYAVEGHIDLHGLTVPEAKAALLGFLRAAAALGRRCVRVVHGKGHGSRGRQPVLKGKVNLWLRQLDVVLAFCSTRPVDGGTGAVYVLLRRD
jgi:DNA-nicking Smr family endonuclease